MSEEKENNIEINGDYLLVGIVVIVISLIISLSIVIPCLISQKRNIEKEITLKQIEIYGEKNFEE